MSLVIKFYFTSSMLNMFQTLIHPSSRACDFSIVITTLVVCSCFDVCWSFGVASLGWYLCGRLKPATRKQEHTTNVVITIEKSQAPDDGCINVRNMLSIEEVK